MFENKLKNIIIDENSSIEKTLIKLKSNGQGACFVINKEKKTFSYCNRW